MWFDAKEQSQSHKEMPSQKEKLYDSDQELGSHLDKTKLAGLLYQVGANALVVGVSWRLMAFYGA